MSQVASSTISPLRWAIIGISPFAFATLYLLLSRWPSYRFTTISDYLALAASVAIFILTVLKLPLKRKKKILIASLGVPVVLLSIGLYSFVFIAAVFGDGL
jgi:hypothetical protein